MNNFFSHLYELRIKTLYALISLVCAFATGYIFSLNTTYIITKPVINLFKNNDSSFILTNVFEAFNTNIILSLYITLFSCIPTTMYFGISFLKPGLFRYEKKIIYLCANLTIINLLLSVIFTFYLIVPAILSFFLSLEVVASPNAIDLKMQLKLFDYVNTICQFLFIYGFFVFQLPGLVYVFVYLYEPKASIFYNKRRFFIIVFLIIGCVFSSPDMWCLFIISLPLIVLFELVVFLSILKNKYKDTFERVA